MNTVYVKRSLTALAAAAALSLPALAAHAAPPKITARQAEAAAVKKIPGTPLSAKYEFEDGHWQYAVLVKARSGLYEVEVNSVTGLVTDTEKTTAAEEASEAAADKKAAMKANGHMTSRHQAPAEAGEKGEAGEKSDAGEGAETGSK